MSRRKQAKPRSLKRDEEWDETNEQKGVENLDQDCETSNAKPDDDEEEDEELQRAFSRASDEYLAEDRPLSLPGPDLDNQNSLDSEALGTGSSSWHSEDAGHVSRRGGDTPSSCATPTSASFPSEPEAEGENGAHTDINNPAAPYPCQFCDRSFPRLSYLKKHEQSHGDQMPYKCSWCARLFKHKRSRDRHVKLHTGDRRYRCTHCEAAFSRSDHLKIHMKTHDTQKPYQCTACSRGYNTAAALTSHMQSHKKHHGMTQNAKLESDYGRGSVSSHSTASPPVPNSPSPSLNLALMSRAQNKGSPMMVVPTASSTPVLHSPLKLACMYCTRDSFTSMQQLQMHVHAMHRAILSGESMTMPSPGQISSASNFSREKMFEQPFKDREKSSDIRTTGGLAEDRDKPLDETNHHRVKKEFFDNSFSCGQCTMKFSNLATLRDHLVSIHRVDGYGATLMCPLCGIPCVSAAAYAEHYVLQHCDDRRVVNFGEHGGDYASSKNNGRSTHKPDSSPVYGTKHSRVADRGAKTSREDGKLSSNDGYESKEQQPADLTNKHGRSIEPYSAGTLLCGQCGAALKDFESFREHLARHLQADHRKEIAKNPCPKCEASFQDREDMLSHLTKHFLGQVTKEYACGVCKKFYPHPDLLQRHLLDSHAHHLYRCALCRDTFDSRVAIQVHFAVKHSQECRIYRCNACPTTNNENSPGNSPGSGSGGGGSTRNLFRSEAEMASHVRAVHAPPTVMTDSPVTRSPVAAPASLSSNLRCVFCGICCVSELELQLHLANHSASLYRCPICREGFAVEFLLDRHMQSRHLESLPTSHNQGRENGRAITSRSHTNEDSAPRLQKRGRSPAAGNNNSVSQRDNNNKRPNYGSSAQQQNCELCERGEFANEAELQAHKKLAHAPPKSHSKTLAALSLTCAYCGESCRSRGELESHTRIQHASNEPGGRHKCNICDEVCPSGATLAEHKLQKHCKILLSDTCVVCRGILNSESQFLEHVQRHSLENVDPQQRVDNSLPHLLPSPCVICRQTLISDLECRLHARYHLRATGSQNASPNSSQKSPNPNCCLCLREFPAEDFVALPSNPLTGSVQSLQVCKSCYARHTQSLPVLHSSYEHVGHGGAKEDPRVWERSKDKWNQNSISNDRSSVQESETVDEAPRCEDCGVKFEAVEELEAHRAQEHSRHVDNQPKTYTCIQCQMSFPTEAEIQKHVRREHLESTGKTSDALRCHLCLTEASSPLQLQAHLIEHTFAGCAALSCYICQALFTAPAGLQNHMLQQHGLGARPYDCSLCGLKFFFRAELDHHVVISHRGRDSVSPREHRLNSASAAKSPVEAEKVSGSDDVKIKDEMQMNEEEEVNVDLHEDEVRVKDEDEDGVRVEAPSVQDTKAPSEPAES